MRSRLPIPFLLTLPGLALAYTGLHHPHDLNVATSEQWWHIHVQGLLVFPLVGVALIVLVRGRNDPVAWVVRLSAYVYMTVYGALDVIDGIGAGYLTNQTPDVPRSMNGADKLFTLGHDYEHYGSWGLIICCIAVTVDQLVRRGPVAIPVVAMVPGAWLVHSDHIFSPNGVTGMVLIGLATGWAAYGVPETRLRPRATSGALTAS